MEKESGKESWSAVFLSCCFFSARPPSPLPLPSFVFFSLVCKNSVSVSHFFLPSAFLYLKCFHSIGAGGAESDGVLWGRRRPR